jgi:hypothetical protein
VTLSLPLLIGLVIAASIIGAVIGYRSKISEMEDTIERQKCALQQIRANLEDHITPKVSEEDTKLLRSLPYSDYLQSDYWRRVRWIVFNDAELRCRVCNSGGLLQAHHRDYSSIGKERLSDLICLCESCHHLFHQNRVLVREQFSDRMKDLHQQRIDKYLEAEAAFQAKQIEHTVAGQRTEQKEAEQDAPSNGGQRPTLNSSFPPRRG